MNEQLQNTINSILQKAIEAATNGAEFLKGEIPEVVQQLLTWKMTEAMLNIGISLLVYAITAIILYKWWKSFRIRHRERCCHTGEDGALWAITCILGIVEFIVFLVFTCGNAFDMLKIWIAPKVYLLEYATRLIHTTNT